MYIKIKKYELWDGEPYNQKNPQTTGKDGIYSFLAPEGRYYITVQAKGYHPFKSEKFYVKENNPIINLNLELNPNLAFEIYYDLKSAPQAALLRTILTSKYSNIPSAKIVFAPCL